MNLKRNYKKTPSHIMKPYIIFLLCFSTLLSCKLEKRKEIKQVATFKGQQVTGVTVSDKGRIFANFPRWRKGIKNSVVEVDKNGHSTSFPNKKWNTWEIGQTITDSVFVAVQSVMAHENNLYVLDTRNPLFKGVIDSPKVFVFDLKTNSLKNFYQLSEDCFHKNSYINDLRVDKEQQKIYFTDSGHAGLVVLDLLTGASKRVLDNHTSTLSEQDYLTFNGKKWNNSVHSDGIALDTQNNLLYYHALTGYSLYAVPTEVLNNGTEKEIEESVQFITKTPAPDGMIFDSQGKLYLADLENNKIVQFNPKTNKISIFAEGEKIKWADTFSIYNNKLYYTNSRINEVRKDVSNLDFRINKIDLN